MIPVNSRIEVKQATEKNVEFEPRSRRFRTMYRRARYQKFNRSCARLSLWLIGFSI